MTAAVGRVDPMRSQDPVLGPDDGGRWAPGGAVPWMVGQKT